VERLDQGAKEAAQEIVQEGKRLGVQGATETASGLFQGTANTFVPYGAGQDIRRFDKGRSRGRDM
jgi:hypothetical protein